jgi:hypothetical protein
MPPKKMNAGLLKGHLETVKTQLASAKQANALLTKQVDELKSDVMMARHTVSAEAA